VHIEAPDESAHQGGDLKLKIKAIEDFDEKLSDLL
jgi:2,3-bisphosphoglycerate-independent phosphoglycerate mutase